MGFGQAGHVLLHGVGNSTRRECEKSKNLATEVRREAKTLDQGLLQSMVKRTARSPLT